MAFSKVTLNNTTLMDVTGDSVTADVLMSGETATRSDGVQITGSLSIDAVPTENSTNPVSSGGVYTALQGKADVTSAVTNVSYNTTSLKIQKTINGTTTDVVAADSSPSSASTNLITSGAVYTSVRSATLQFVDSNSDGNIVISFLT